MNQQHATGLRSRLRKLLRVFSIAFSWLKDVWRLFRAPLTEATERLATKNTIETPSETTTPAAVDTVADSKSEPLGTKLSPQEIYSQFTQRFGAVRGTTYFAEGLNLCEAWEREAARIEAELRESEAETQRTVNKLRALGVDH